MTSTGITTARSHNKQMKQTDTRKTIDKHTWGAPYLQAKKQAQPTMHNCSCMHEHVWEVDTTDFFYSLTAALLKTTACTRWNKETVGKGPRKLHDPPNPDCTHTVLCCLLHRAWPSSRAPLPPAQLFVSWSSGGVSQTGRAVPSYWGTGGASWDSTFIVL